MENASVRRPTVGYIAFRPLAVCCFLILGRAADSSLDSKSDKQPSNISFVSARQELANFGR